MKDRLIELLKQIDFDYSEECFLASENGYRCAPDFAEYFSDHLLANGVIVPPCKVGDTVYQIDGVRIYESEVCKIIYDTGHIAFDEDAIGKSIFLTGEEAEKALEGKT